jgi:ribosomal protein S18 acetylase RimI-like enzyme
MLGRAFANDPFFVSACPDAAEREAKLPYMAEYFLRYSLSYGEAYATSPRLEGIAVWMRLEKVSMPFWRVLLYGVFWSVLKMGLRTARRLRGSARYIDNKHEKLMPVTHWYLALLAIDPEFQGRGYASQLIREMLPRIDEEGLPCYLETENERNVPIYQHFGFKVIDEFTIPGTTIRVWAMLRENR